MARVAVLVLAIGLAVSAPAATMPACAGDDGATLRLHADYDTGSRFDRIRLRGTLRLATRPVDGRSVHGLSGLAWSPAHKRLIAVSDLGFVVHIEPHFRDGFLTGVSYCATYPLRDAAGAPLAGRWRDAEGLRLRPATTASQVEELLVSFEQQPRVLRYTLDGQWLGELPLPDTLREQRNYQHPNLALEALTETRRFGVIVAPERPLAEAPDGPVPLVSLNGPSFPFHVLDARHSAVVGLETLPDDDLLVLERRYVSPLRPIIIALSRVDLPSRAGAATRQTQIARFDTTAGWGMDNFESIARQRDNLYFMLSDDNASSLQHTVLVYFEVLDDEPPPARVPPAPLSRHRL